MRSKDNTYMCSDINLQFREFRRKVPVTVQRGKLPFVPNALREMQQFNPLNCLTVVIGLHQIQV